MNTSARLSRERFLKLIEWTLRCAIAIVAVLLLFNLVYFFHGSMEMFPTEERQSGIREVTGLAALMLCLVEVGLCLALRRVRQISA
jgi:hypothetical protein